jgi:hypothetical protein
MSIRATSEFADMLAGKAMHPAIESLTSKFPKGTLSVGCCAPQIEAYLYASLVVQGFRQKAAYSPAAELMMTNVFRTVPPASVTGIST